VLDRADHAALARGVAFVLLEIGLCGVGFAYASLLTFHPVNVPSCRVENRELQAPAAIEHNQIKFDFGGIENLVSELSTNQIREALDFSRFRFKLIEFLKLPFDIREPALREVLERTCCGAYRNYLARAKRVEKILKSEDTLELEDTLETNFRVPLVMDHRQSDSPNR
jgi:hypothetical protein